MNILMIFQTSPYPPDLGPAKRNFPFMLENLKRHEVSVLSFGTPEEEHVFRDRFGRACKHIVFIDIKHSRALNFALRLWRLVTGRSSYLKFYSPRLERALKELISKENFDVIHCCTTILGYHQLPNGIPLVGDAHNVEHDNLFRTYEQTTNIIQKPYFYLDYLRLKQEETEITDKFDVIVTTTDRDRQIYRKALPNKRIEVIPNGVDEAFFETQIVQEEAKTMVFTGLMNYFPNLHGVEYFLDEIFPLILDREPESRLLVVGAYPPKKLLRRANHNVIVTGWVDDIKPYFARGQVFVIPLLIGGGIRGKALESMAMKRPIVTTTLGCEGINLKHEESALFADTPQEFADAVVRLFNEASLRKRLVDKAYQNVVEGYSWESNGRALEEVYRSLTTSNELNLLAGATNGRVHATKRKLPHTSVSLV